MKKATDRVSCTETLENIIISSGSHWEAWGRIEETIGLDMAFYLLTTRPKSTQNPSWYAQFVEKIESRTIDFHTNIKPIEIYSDSLVVRLLANTDKIHGDDKIIMAAQEWARFITVTQIFNSQLPDPETRLGVVWLNCLKTVKAYCSQTHQEYAHGLTRRHFWPMPEWIFAEKFRLAFLCLSVLASQSDRDEILDHLLSFHCSPGAMLEMMLADGNYPLECFEKALDFHFTDCRSVTELIRYKQKLDNPLAQWNTHEKTAISNAISTTAQKAAAKAKELATTVDDWTGLLKANIVSLAEVESRFRDADFAVWQIIATGVLQPTDVLANILTAKAKTRDQLVVAFKHAKTEGKKEEIFRILLTCANATFEHFHEIFKGCEQHDRDGRDFCAVWWPQIGFYAVAFDMMVKLAKTEEELKILINFEKNQTPQYG